jgi:hypothetical protein
MGNLSKLDLQTISVEFRSGEASHVRETDCDQTSPRAYALIGPAFPWMGTRWLICRHHQ